MSGYDDLTSDSCWPDRTDREHIERAAVLAVLHRVDQGQLTRADAHEALQALGLIGEDQPEETRLPSASAQARRRRRAAERERKREEGAA